MRRASHLTSELSPMIRLRHACSTKGTNTCDIFDISPVDKVHRESICFFVLGPSSPTTQGAWKASSTMVPLGFTPLSSICSVADLPNIRLDTICEVDSLLIKDQSVTSSEKLDTQRRVSLDLIYFSLAVREAT